MEIESTSAVSMPQTIRDKTLALSRERPNRAPF